MIEVLKQALEALKEYVDVVVSVNDPNDWRTVADGGKPAREAITSLRQAIAELESQEPVACKECHLKDTVYDLLGDLKVANLKLSVRSQRTWVGLTDVELAEYADMEIGSYDRCLEVEAKLKEKNT